ncbi:MAG: hypothetical protein QGG71_02760 [Pirellulaceae bacterium]|nr:hypothetical protein [Pirellulaceae bacterium]
MRLQSGESVLIHSAAGGVGQAAIQVVRRAGAKIFATAGSDQRFDPMCVAARNERRRNRVPFERPPVV